MNSPILGLPGLKSLGAKLGLTRNLLVTDVGKTNLVSWQEGDVIARVSCNEAIQQLAVESFQVEDIWGRINPELQQAQKRQVMDCLVEFDDTWKQTKLGTCTALQHNVDTSDHPPVSDPPRRFSPEKMDEINSQTEDLLKAGPGRLKSSWQRRIGGGWPQTSLCGKYGCLL